MTPGGTEAAGVVAGKDLGPSGVNDGMEDRRGTEEDLAKLPPVIVGTRYWPAAERAGLVSVGGFWMKPEHAEKFKEHHRKLNEERRQDPEREEGGEEHS